MTDREKDQCLQMAEWYAVCPRFAHKRLVRDFSLWVHLFLWAGMLDK